MNILTDALPTAVQIEDTIYEINTDFRNIIKIILAFDDPELAGIEKQVIILALLYKDNIPKKHVVAASKLAARFISGPMGESDEEGDTTRYYSFTKDSPLIYAAFQQTHGIDLQKASLHWWQFIALFSDLGSETIFCNIVNLRRRVAIGEASKEEIKAARRMGSSFDVEQYEPKSIDEMEAERHFLALERKRKERKHAS